MDVQDLYQALMALRATEEEREAARAALKQSNRSIVPKLLPLIDMEECTAEDCKKIVAIFKILEPFLLDVSDESSKTIEAIGDQMNKLVDHFTDIEARMKKLSDNLDKPMKVCVTTTNKAAEMYAKSKGLDIEMMPNDDQEDKYSGLSIEEKCKLDSLIPGEVEPVKAMINSGLSVEEATVAIEAIVNYRKSKN